METLVIQTGIRHGRFAEVTRNQGSELTIGRAYSNDLILTSPHVAPNQLVLRYEEDAWWLIVLESVNTVSVNGKKCRQRTRIQSGDQIAIGRIKLSVFHENHAIAATQKLGSGLLGMVRAINPWLAILLSLLLVLFSFGLSYFEGSTDLKWKTSASSTLSILIMIGVWAGLCSAIGLIFRQQHELWSQLIIACGVFVFAESTGLLQEYLFYPINAPQLFGAASWVIGFLTLTLVLALSLSIALPLKRPTLVATVLVTLGFSVALGQKWMAEPSIYESSQPQYSNSLKPPLLGLIDGEVAESYWASVESKVEAVGGG